VILLSSISPHSQCADK